MPVIVEGEERIAATVSAVWEALNSPMVLNACIPGCESLKKVSETAMEASILLAIGPIKAKFVGGVEFLDINPPNSYTIKGEGKGGIAGFAKGTAAVHLEGDGTGTVLSYRVTADVGGKIAQLGNRLIQSTSKKLAGQFFSNFNKIVSA
ncbi:MAG: CoxG family protein [Pseudorhodoplanes sp.]